MSGFHFQKHSVYALLRFTPDISEMAWGDIDAETRRVGQSIHESPKDPVIVDLSQLTTLPAGLVASLVRTWKEMDQTTRQFVVVASQSTVREQLEQDGLASLWKLAESLKDAYQMLGLPESAESEFSPAASPKSGEALKNASADAQAGPDPISFQEQNGYCSLTLGPQLVNMDWQGVDAATTAAIEKLRASKHKQVIVDLSRMSYINSGLVASLVRIWKATQKRQGLFSVISPNDSVTEVLKIAGLWKMWSVVDDHEEATYELGVSKVAIVERRERRTLMFLALACAAISAITLIPIFLGHEKIGGVSTQMTALLLSLLACVFGLLSVIKDSGIPRFVSVFSLLLAIGVLSTLWLREHSVPWGN